MDFVKNLSGGSKEGEQQGQQQSSSGGGFTDKLNSMAGGGSSGEKKEDGLDKGKSSSILLLPPSSFIVLDQCKPEGALVSGSNMIRDGMAGLDWVQENVMGQGDQSNESAFEQAKDEQISGEYCIKR